MEETTIPATGVESVTIVITAGVEGAQLQPNKGQRNPRMPRGERHRFRLRGLSGTHSGHRCKTRRPASIVKQLDIASGEYTAIYSLPFDRTPRVYWSMNAVGINPVDFDCLRADEVAWQRRPESYLVRFDKLRTLPSWPRSRSTELLPAASTTTEPSSGRSAPDLYAIYGIAEMEGFARPGRRLGPVRDRSESLAGITPTVGFQTLPPSRPISVTVKALTLWAITNQADKLGSTGMTTRPASGSVDAFRSSDGSNDRNPHREQTSGPRGVTTAGSTSRPTAEHGVYEVLIDTIDLEAGTAEIQTCREVRRPPPGMTA